MTEYQKIDKVMSDNICATIQVFNNVHQRLGGLHTIMNSSDSVGNIWWCRQNAIPDLIKHCKTKWLLPLHEVLCQCWQEGAVPRDTRDSNIITIYKNKGERNDNNNYRGISLHSIVGKVFARVILIRLQKLAERIYPKSQCGFRAERSPIDMILSLRQLQEKCREQHMPLYIAFIDLTKAFDLVSRDGLFKVLPKIGCPPKMQSMIESFHTDTKGTVQFNGSFSEPFEIRSGVKQGCVLTPTLFWDFIWPVAKTCLRHNNIRNLLSCPLRWHALQPRPSQSQDAVCWWCSSCDPRQGGTPDIDGLLLTGL